ncbi:MAG: HAD family hydrolase [Coriobacteriia bacterium]|nr:HAD family hydrolase [Coriobacteriia bacterium]
MRAILFDLDGTLLDIDMGRFLMRYFDALSEVIAGLVPAGDLESSVNAVSEATEAMVKPHPGRTNKEVFRDEYVERTGIDIDEHADAFARFYEERFPLLGDGLGPSPGAHDALAKAESLGLRVAIATNPIFPLRAIEHRLTWAGIATDRPHVITAYESMHACKPLGDYYRETARMLDVPPEECMMVGDDAILDMAAGDVGMATFYTGSGYSPHASYTGTLLDLEDLLTRIGM